MYRTMWDKGQLQDKERQNKTKNEGWNCEKGYCMQLNLLEIKREKKKKEKDEQYETVFGGIRPG